jgi:hypothetical protein
MIRDWYLVAIIQSSFVFQFTVQKHKNLDIPKYNLTCGFDRVWTLVAGSERGTYVEDIREQGAEEHTWV